MRVRRERRLRERAVRERERENKNESISDPIGYTLSSVVYTFSFTLCVIDLFSIMNNLYKLTKTTTSDT
jgi:hypothetical protein